MVCCQWTAMCSAPSMPPPDPHTEESTMQDAIIVHSTHDDARTTHPAVSRRGCAPRIFNRWGRHWGDTLRMRASSAYAPLTPPTWARAGSGSPYAG